MRIHFLIFLTLLTFSIQAQDLDLSYEEAVRIALEQNVSLRTQKNELKIANPHPPQAAPRRRSQPSPSRVTGCAHDVSSADTDFCEMLGRFGRFSDTAWDLYDIADCTSDRAS